MVLARSETSSDEVDRRARRIPARMLLIASGVRAFFFVLVLHSPRGYVRLRTAHRRAHTVTYGQVADRSIRPYVEEVTSVTESRKVPAIGEEAPQDTECP